MLLVGEYTWARNTWYNAQHQNANIGSVGTVFTW